MKKAMKKGRFSKKEIQFIEQECESTPYEEIASSLDRDVESVTNFIRNKLGKGLSETEKFEVKAGYDLHARPYWRDLKQQFKPDELEMITYHWSRIISQFRDDVLPTEELQVIDAIKLEILMNRCLKEQGNNSNDVDDIQKLLDDERKLGRDEQDFDRILNLERQVAVLRAAQESLSKDYKDLQGRKNVLLKELKGTREQRIQRLEDAKHSFIGWVKNLTQNPDEAHRIGLEMEKMRLAMEKEQTRLSGYHKYDDGTIDQPFLTPENVKND